MNCAVERHNCGNVKMKTLNYVKNSYQKEQDFNNIVDQLCTRLQDIKDCDRPTGSGMRMRQYDQAEAVRRYCAAFPALIKGEGLPQYWPPPEWCRRDQENIRMMQVDIEKDYSLKTKKMHGRRGAHPRKGGKRRSHSRGKGREPLPEWVTHGAAWHHEDPLQALLGAADEGYGTAEHTCADVHEDALPPLPPMDALAPSALVPRQPTPQDEEMYARFEAKFDRSLEALWAADTPDDCQELPIDFHDLLASPSDNMFLHPAAEARVPTPPPEPEPELHARLRPLRLDEPEPELHARLRPLRLDEPEPFSLYSYEGIYEAVPSVADVMRSLTVLNHSKRSSFMEVLPRPRQRAPPAPAPPPPVPASSSALADPRDDPLTSERTHFRPIRKEAETEPAPRHEDGATFDISGELEPAPFTRSESGGLYLEQGGEKKRWLEMRTRGIDYSRLNLTAALRREHHFEEAAGLRLRFVPEQTDVAVQTEPEPPEPSATDARAAWACAECGGRGAKLMRADDGEADGAGSIWGAGWECGGCAGGGARAPAPPQDVLLQEWEELLADIAAAHAQYATEAVVAAASVAGSGGGGGEGDRKRRRPRPHASCSHPHAPFLACPGALRPLTR